MPALDEFADIVKRNELLAPHTYLRLGGTAEFFVQPRSREELAAVVRRCFQEQLPLRVIGEACNVLVRDEGVRGVVVRLVEPAFREIHVQGKRVMAGAGAAVSALISNAAKAGLAGLETLVGIPGTVGGALRCNAGDRTGEIGQYVRRVEVVDSRHAAVWREHEELSFHENRSNLDDPVILTAEFELETDRDEAIVKRMLKTWIVRKAKLPHSFETAARIFKNPRGLQAGQLIESAALGKIQVGGAGLSERNANYVVAAPNASARDVLRLIDLVRTKVREQSGVSLEQDILVW